MRTRTHTLLVFAALFGTGVAPVWGQGTAFDPRWLAYLGCWEPIESAKSQLCIVPATDASTVDFVTVVKGEVSARERIAAIGERIETIKGDCAAWHSAAWSANGQRIYLRSDDPCAGGTGRRGTGLIAMSGNSQWLYIQGMTVRGQTGLRVQRYREAPADILVPNEVAVALRIGVSATREARAAAAAPLSIDDVIETSKSVETAVLEAWLVERGEPFTLDAKRLITLADAGVPAPVIDLMVALSYPKVFAINAASRRGERNVVPAGGSRGRTYASGPVAPISALCRPSYLMYPYAPSYSYSPFDCPGWGAAYGGGWYAGGYPVQIVVIRPEGGSRPHGRAVNGRGYSQGGNDGTAAKPRAAFEPTGPTSTGSVGASSAGSSSSSASSGEQRTAKPRPE